MSAYYELREALAASNLRHSDWVYAASASGVDPALIVLEGRSSIKAWSNILKAVYTNRKIPNMRDFLARVDPKLLPVFDKFALEVGASNEDIFNDLPELETLEVSEAALQIGAATELMSVAEELDDRLLTLAFGPQPLSPGAVDTALSGSHTAAAKARLEEFQKRANQALDALQGRESAANLRVKGIEKRIAEVKDLRPPTPPMSRVRPYPPEATIEQRNLWDEQVEQAERLYTEEWRRYEDRQNTLPELQASAEAAKGDRDSIRTEISEHRARAELNRQSFRSAIDAARDQDLLVAFDSVMQGARSAMRGGVHPIRGFGVLLAGTRALNVVMRAATSPSTATEAARRYNADADGLAHFVEENVVPIARACLAGPLIVQRQLAANRQALAKLGERLDRVDAAQIDEALQRAQALLVPPPEIPEYKHLEAPEDIDRVRAQLDSQDADQGRRIDRLETYLAEELQPLSGEVDLALSDGAAVTACIGGRLGATRRTLERSQWYWKLISYGSTASELPPAVRAICTELPREFARRAEAKVDDVFSEATRTEFSLPAARSLIAGHRTTVYRQVIERVHRATVEFCEHRQRIWEAQRGLAGRAAQVAKDYRLSLTCTAAFATVPVIGLISAGVANAVVGRLQRLVCSDWPIYVKLGDHAVLTMAVAIALSAIGGVALTWATVLLLDAAQGLWIGLSAASYWIAAVVFAANLFTVRRYRNDRGVAAESEGPAAAIE